MIRAFISGSTVPSKCGALVLLITLLIILIGPWVAPYGADQVVGEMWEPWNKCYLLGTGREGRDFLSLLILGTRATVGVALLAALAAFVLGAASGLAAGTIGGWLEPVLSWAADTIVVVPAFIWLVLVMAVSVAPGTSWVIGVCAIIFAAPVYRLARALAVNALVTVPGDPPGTAREGLWGTLELEVWPLARRPLFVELGLRFCATYMFINAASFLGLGITGTAAEWVSLAIRNTTLITYGDLTPFIPVAALIIVPFSVHLMVGPFRHPANEIYDRLNLEIALPPDSAAPEKAEKAEPDHQQG